MQQGSWFSSQPASGQAHTTMTVGSNQQANAKRRANLATRESRKGPGNASRNNLYRMARNTERLAGLQRGSVSARQAEKGNIYIEAKHTPVEGWGGEEEVLTHFSAHVPSHKNSPIGQYHAKTESLSGNLQHQARVIPTFYKGTDPDFNKMVAPVGRRNLAPGYPSQHFGAKVAESMGKAYTTFTRKGGRKTMKKKSRKLKTRRHH